ncbi:hypothetical protein MLD38_010219 [Melastoma candidum]|uniref:Uncharacterized protein n=1 Tax=Melastoma candidum TaxID=119954 RepID=A0ACB9QZA0_9MYRT|nr:hypothetical protein MLD38_010219 [Melastoma candidum]
MAEPSSPYLSLGLAFLLLFHATTTSAQLVHVTSQPFIQGQGQQLHQPRHSQSLRRGEECRLDRLDALEPSRRIEAEAGVTEIWDETHEQLECAGVAFVRHIIRFRGLFLPAFTNAPEIFYVVRGRGLHGAAFPGCPETYEEQRSQESQTRFQEEGFRGDRHQKVRRIREGDIVALPAGTTHWIYNDDQTDLVIVSMIHLSNQENQLDQNFRKFFLAGNPNQQEGQQGRRGGRWSSWSQRRFRGEGQQEEESFGNIFSGFDPQFISESFNVHPDVARRLQGREDNRGHIVEVQKELDIVHPEYREGEEEREWERERERERGWEGTERRRRFLRRAGDWSNGLEETICTARLRENINNPVRADVYNPRGGRFTTVNGFSLPILQYLQLSAERVVLYRDALVTPHYYMNCHGVVYCTRGNGRIQIANEEGENVFDGELQEGQLIVVPQAHAVLKKAGQQGFEYIAFRTNDQAMITQLAGRLSVLRGLPDDVVMNAYDVSRDEAREIKYNREELTVLSPQGGARGLSMRD